MGERAHTPRVFSPWRRRYLAGLRHEQLRGRRMDLVARRSLLCHTLAGHRCDLVTISDFSATAEEMANRPNVVFTGRVHPGETNASWMMKGVLDFLLGDTEEANMLRRMFVFKVSPF